MSFAVNDNNSGRHGFLRAHAHTEVYANNLQPSAEQGTMHLTLRISKDFKSFFSYPAEG